jgi:Peptidase family M49
MFRLRCVDYALVITSLFSFTLTEYPSSKGTEYVQFSLSFFSNISDVSSLYVDEELTFIHPDDVEIYNTWDSRAFELQVANHELLGHGSGKLFQEGADGKRNFDPEKVTCLCIAIVNLFSLTLHSQIINPLTGKHMLVSNVPMLGPIVQPVFLSQHVMVQTWPDSGLSFGGGIFLHGGMPR